MALNDRSLTLKYRPAFFRDVVGQEAVSRALLNAVASSRIHPAYIFHGSRGSGKTSTARIFAKALNCRERSTDGEPCGECAACGEIAGGRSLDVMEIDAASHTQVDHIREVVLDTVNLAPARDRYRIFIIDEVHMLSSASFNAMLKTLEEPPDHVVFILATTELHKVPATVVSRTQSFPFRAFAVGEIVERLKFVIEREQIAVAADALDEIARSAGGSLRDALSILEQLLNLAGSKDVTIERRDLTQLLGFVEGEMSAALVEALAVNADFESTQRLIQEILYQKGHSPAQLLGSLFRESSAALLNTLQKNRVENSAGRLYMLCEHILKLQGELRFASDPILACEVGLAGFLVNQGEPLCDQGAPMVAAAPVEPRLEAARPALLPKAAPVAGDKPIEPPPVKKPQAPPIAATAALGAVAQESPAPDLAAALTPEVLLNRLSKAMQEKNWGLYMRDADLQIKPGAGYELLVTGRFNFLGVEKNWDQISALWRGLAGENSKLSFSMRADAPGASRSPADAGCEPETVPQEKPVEVPEDLKKIAKVFGGKIKRFKKT
ncbi:MAG: DNA polymerase III subunit gamma/tau [Elusimicrobia bacterium]|nr:DNA polymerase III subunit gamma/tau [Elusimicrobiota bacterium]